MAVELEKQRGRVESALASPCKVLELRGKGALQLCITEQLCVCVSRITGKDETSVPPELVLLASP